MATKKIVEPKYPRIIVSGKRHMQLQREAKRQGVAISVLVEQIFKAASGGKK